MTVTLRLRILSPTSLTALFILLPSVHFSQQFSQVDVRPIAHLRDKKKCIDILVETSRSDNVHSDDTLNDRSLSLRYPRLGKLTNRAAASIGTL